MAASLGALALAAGASPIPSKVGAMLARLDSPATTELLAKLDPPATSAGESGRPSATGPDLAVSKHGPAAVAAGEAVRYTLALTNVGDVTATGAALIDTLPPDMLVLGINPTGAIANGAIKWSLGDIGPGAGATFSITGVVPTDLVNGAQVTNTVHIRDGAFPDPVPANNDAFSVGIVVPQNLTLDVTGPAHVAPGGTLTYRILVSNTGGATLPDVTVTHTLPAELTALGATDGAQLVSEQVWRWSFGPLAAGATRLFTATAQVPLSLTVGSLLVGEATASTSVSEATAADNDDRWETTLEPADLFVGIASNSGDVRPGELLTHTLTLANVSDQLAEQVAITVTLDPRTQWVADTAASAGFDEITGDGGVLVWSRPSISPLATLYVDLVTRVSPTATMGISIVHAAAVRAATFDGVPGNDQAQSLPVPVVVPDLWLQKTGPVEVAAGNIFTYTLAFGNRGGGGAPGAVLTDTLPAGLVFQGAQPPPTLVNSRTLTWELGSVAVGGDDQFKVQARVNSGLSTAVSLTNRAAISSPWPDQNPADNASAASAAILPGPPATLTLGVPSVLAVGGGIGPVTAQVFDSAGNPVLDGTPVTLTTTLGGLGAASLPTLTLPTAGGRITTSLRSDANAGTAQVKARAGGVETQSSVFITGGPPTTVTLTATPITVTAGQATVLSVQVRDALGNLATDGTPVSLVGSTGEVTPSQLSTLGGLASASWRGTLAGRTVLTATAGAASKSITVTVLPGTPERLNVSAEPSLIPVDDGRTTLRATILDAFGNSVSDGFAVVFTPQGGTMVTPTVTTRDGLATTVFKAGAKPGTFTQTIQAGQLSWLSLVTIQPTNLSLSADLRGPRGRAIDSQTYPGEALTYTLGIRNAGLAMARGVMVGALLPIQLTEITVTEATVPMTPTATLKPGLLPKASEDQLEQGWLLPPIASGDLITLTLSGLLDPLAAWTGFDTLFFQAAITTTTAEASNTDMIRASTGRVYAADLFTGVQLDASSSSIRPGGSLIYNLSFGNLQAQTEVLDARITATLPAGLSLESWDPVSGAKVREASVFTPYAQQLVWSVDGSLDNTQNLRLRLKVAADVPPATVLETFLEIGSSVFDLEPANNRNSDGGVYLRGTNLTAQLTSADSAMPGDVVNVRLHVANNSERDAANNTTVLLTLPTGAHPISSSPPATIEGDRLRWQIVALGPLVGQDYLAAVQIPETATLGSVYRLDAQAESDSPDSYPADNRATLLVRIVPGPPASLTLERSAASLAACGQAHAVLTATVKDRVGMQVADGTVVRWSTTAGTWAVTGTVPVTGMAGVSGTLTVGGKATIALPAPAQTGKATIKAAVGPITDAIEASTTVDFVAGPPAALTLTADPMEIAWRGRTTLTLRASDACRHPVANGTSLVVTTARGRLTPNGSGTGGLSLTLKTAAGMASAVLDVGDESGPLQITARALTGGAQAELEVTVGERPAATATPVASPTPPRPKRFTVYAPYLRQARVR